MDPIVNEVIRLGGGVAALARHLRISSQAVSKWQRIPVERVPAIEAYLQSRHPEEPVPDRYKMRPDIYGP